MFTHSHVVVFKQLSQQWDSGWGSPSVWLEASDEMNPRTQDFLHLETHGSEILRRSRCDLAYRWCQDLQMKLRGALHDNVVHKKGDGHGKADVGETTLHEDLET